MAIISVLVALALPALSEARRSAQRIQCRNNLRNINLALLQATESAGRFPACGNFGFDPETGTGRAHHSWVADALPWLEQEVISGKWDKDKPLTDPANQALAQTHVPVLVCPSDISAIRRGEDSARGNLSYVVNGGVGFTVQYQGVHDCPVDRGWTRLDLNGNSTACSQNALADGNPSDKDHFFSLGLFFNETWKWDVTRRHHRPASVQDGMSQTITLAENVRTGRDPSNPDTSWASPMPNLTSFYIGNPCRGGNCSEGNVDYQRCNAGRDAINSGITAPEGTAPVPNSFHRGGVHMGFADGRVQFVSEQIDGAVYAALASPRGMQLTGTPLAQIVAQWGTE